MRPTLVSPRDSKLFSQAQPKYNLSCVFHAGSIWNSVNYNATSIRHSEYLKQQQTPAHRLKEETVKKVNNKKNVLIMHGDKEETNPFSCFFLLVS